MCWAPHLKPEKFLLRLKLILSGRDKTNSFKFKKKSVKLHVFNNSELLSVNKNKTIFKKLFFQNHQIEILKKIVSVLLFLFEYAGENETAFSHNEFDLVENDLVHTL